MANKTVSENKNFGLVAWNDATKTAIVSIRGTKTIWEWIADAGALPVPYFQDPGAGLAHLGFQIVYQRIRDSIAGLLRANCQGAQTLWVTGHSMGGALAILCAYDILKEVNLGPVPQLYTFAGPRVLAPDFADTFNTAIHICNRVVNFLDFVPQIPTPPLYEHAGQETLVKGGFNAFDISFAHHLTTYLNGLNQLP